MCILMKVECDFEYFFPTFQSRKKISGSVKLKSAVILNKAVDKAVRKRKKRPVDDSDSSSDADSDAGRGRGQGAGSKVYSKSQRSKSGVSALSVVKRMSSKGGKRQKGKIEEEDSGDDSALSDVSDVESDYSDSPSEGGAHR